MVNHRIHDMNQEKYYFERFDDIATISHNWSGGQQRWLMTERSGVQFQAIFTTTFQSKIYF